MLAEMKELNSRKLCLGLLLSTLASLLLGSCKPDAKKEHTHEYTNALARESSPYLLQHAHNPVDWRPWDEAAFEEAARTGKLVLISIGYATCHWCHVMEEETFEDLEVARIMNANFINIKVDREERPDVDDTYMKSVRLMGGSGGWPLNVIALPDGKPLYGGTYHTKSDWMRVLTKTYDLYKSDPNKAAEYAKMVAKGVASLNVITESDMLREDARKTVTSAVSLNKNYWDTEWGGIKGETKFILPGYLSFLSDYSLLAEDRESGEHLKRTLDRIIQAGIYDHVGGGFFRYSTDAQWQVPHFEKMLYDNAQLLSLFSRAYKTFQDPDYERVVRETILFLNREMKNPKGGYYAALDADSEGVEGKYYTWEGKELKELLGQDYDTFSGHFEVLGTEQGQAAGILLPVSGREENLSTITSPTDEPGIQKDRWRALILAKRMQRVAPGVDYKIITSWNALLITGLVDAFEAFKEDSYLKQAKAVYDHLYESAFYEGKLVHSVTRDTRQDLGFLEDYAYLAQASLRLYKVTLDTEYLENARVLDEATEKYFKEEGSPMFRFSLENQLFTKIINANDGVLPSANGVVARNRYMMGHLLGDSHYSKNSGAMLASVQPALIQSLDSYYTWGSLALHSAFPFYEVVVVGDKARQKMEELMQLPLPNCLLAGTEVASKLPLFESRYVPGSTYIYVCRDNACKLPVQTVEEALVQLENFKE